MTGAGLTVAGERWWRPFWPDPLEPRLAQIEPRLARVEQREDRAPAPNAAGDLDRRLTEAEALARQASMRAQAADERTAAATARSEEAAKQVPAAAPAPLDTALVDQLGTRIAGLEEEVRKRGQEAQAVQDIQTRLGDQDQRLGALSRQLADRLAADTRTGEALERRLTEQERRTAEQDGLLAGLARRSAGEEERGTALAQRLGDQERRLGDQDKRVSEQDKRSAEQGQRLADLAQGLAAERRDEAAQRAGLKLTLADHLAGDLGRGAPYAPTLEALRRLNVDQASLSPLEPFAAAGAPRVDALATEFSTLAERVRAEARAAASAPLGESWEDRIRRMAGALVTIRPVQEASGAGSSGPGDPIAVVERALGQGEVASAAKAWADLPEPVRRSGEALGTKLKQRAAAEGALRKITADALGAVGAPAR